MSDKEVNTISHLLEVEQNASTLTLKAQEDADKKIAATKLQADSEFQNQYTKIVSDYEKSFESKKSELEASKKQKISDYKEKISSASTDKNAFNSYLDSLLFA